MPSGVVRIFVYTSHFQYCTPYLLRTFPSQADTARWVFFLSHLPVSCIQQKPRCISRLVLNSWQLAYSVVTVRYGITGQRASQTGTATATTSPYSNYSDIHESRITNHESPNSPSPSPSPYPDLRSLLPLLLLPLPLPPSPTPNSKLHTEYSS